VAPPVYSTTLFPDVLGQTLDRRHVFVSLHSPFETAADQSLSVSPGASGLLWTYNLGWQNLPVTDAQAIFHAVEFMGGDVSGLYFFEWPAYTYLSVYVGLGDGTSNPITLPVKAATGGTTAVRANGVSVPGTFSAATGPNGEDRWLPSGVVTNGFTIRTDFTGRRRRKVRPVDKNAFHMTVRPRSAPLLYTATLALIETTASDV
jgi:hypothetical protein